jgi:carbonic anhydrase/acetyltransferase-like protein (isoleucine patch superfamily)
LRALGLRAVQRWDRLRIARLRALHPGLVFEPGASTNLAAGRYALEPGARVVFGAGVHADRTPGGLVVIAGRDARIEIGAGTWLRGETEPVRLVAFAGAELRVGPDAFLNGCHLSAKRSLRLGRRAWVGLGSRVFDSDQHDRDSEHPEVIAPVEIGDHTWVAADVTVLKGVRIGSHCVVGTRSLVTRDVPDHSLAFGIPAIVRGKVGDRTSAR